MIELLLVLLLAAVGAGERLIASRRWDAERRHLLAIIVAQDVSPAAAASVARRTEPRHSDDEPRQPIVPIGL